MAQAEGRVLLTFDKDFGELAFKARLPATSGVILVRAMAPSPDELSALVVSTIDARQDWAGQFSVIENDTVRMTPLPADR